MARNNTAKETGWERIGMESGLRQKEPQAYSFDYDGSCRPNNANVSHGWNNTFSVGIFQWVPMASGKGLKRSAVVHRIRGYSSNPQEVYDKAEKWIGEHEVNLPTAPEQEGE